MEKCMLAEFVNVQLDMSHDLYLHNCSLMVWKRRGMVKQANL